MLNDLIRWVYEQDLTQAFYRLFHIVGLLTSLVFNLWYCKKYGIGKIKGLLITLVQNIFGTVWNTVYGWLFTGFSGNMDGNVVRMIIFIPLFVLIVAKLFRVEWKRACDFLVPSRLLYFGIAKLGCVFSGCCAGYRASWGIFNIRYQTTAFPTPVIEAITIFVIMAMILMRAKSQNYKVDGLSIPLMFIVYGGTRFLLEFARDNEKIFLGCSDMAFHALFVVVVGVVMYVIIKRYNSAHPENAEETLLNSENI